MNNILLKKEHLFSLEPNSGLLEQHKYFHNQMEKLTIKIFKYLKNYRDDWLLHYDNVEIDNYFNQFYSDIIKTIKEIQDVIICIPQEDFYFYINNTINILLMKIYKLKIDLIKLDEYNEVIHETSELVKLISKKLNKINKTSIAFGKYNE